jgi:hypothetical protein
MMEDLGEYVGMKRTSGKCHTEANRQVGRKHKFRGPRNEVIPDLGLLRRILTCCPQIPRWKLGVPRVLDQDWFGKTDGILIPDFRIAVEFPERKAIMFPDRSEGPTSTMAHLIFLSRTTIRCDGQGQKVTSLN